MVREPSFTWIHLLCSESSNGQFAGLRRNWDVDNWIRKALKPLKPAYLPISIFD